MRTLKLLEVIEHHKSPSQRDIARALGMSLGLVNSFVKRLAKKGYFKITHLPRNRIRYILTPKGAAEKSRLTYSYIQLSYQFYRDARRKIRALLQDLQDQKVRSVAFFGTGELGEIAYLSLQETEIRFAGIGDIARNENAFFGHSVIDIDSLVHMRLDAVIITNAQADNDVRKCLISAGLCPEKIMTF